MSRKPDLSITLGRTKFQNPVLAASGTFGYASEFERFYPVRTLGGIVTKTITLKARLGNPPRRVVETPGGMLNAIGLQNVGAEKFVTDKLPYLRKLGIPVIVSVMGYSAGEFREVIRFLDARKGIDGFEMNLSCPNVSYGTGGKSGSDRRPRMFAHSAELIREAVSAARRETKKLLIAKLGPDVSDIAGMALAAESAGADAVSLINTLTAMVIDIESRKPVLANRTGGLSGPCIRPVAVRMVSDVFRAVRVPVIGMGGIANWHDAAEFLIAGAALVQVGTMNFVNPWVGPEILRGLEDFLRKEKITRVRDLIGTLKE